jgi:hypothetical protein
MFAAQCGETVISFSSSTGEVVVAVVAGCRSDRVGGEIRWHMRILRYHAQAINLPMGCNRLISLSSALSYGGLFGVCKPLTPRFLFSCAPSAFLASNLDGMPVCVGEGLSSSPTDIERDDDTEGLARVAVGGRSVVSSRTRLALLPLTATQAASWTLVVCVATICCCSQGMTVCFARRGVPLNQTAFP